MTEAKLSKKCLSLWNSVLWTWIAIITLLSFLPMIITRYNGICSPGLLVIPVIIIIVSILGYLYMVAYWKKFRYSYDEKEIRVFSGVWWHKQTLVPYSRITNIDIMQGPWQRARDLATLKVQTAGQGANSGAEMQIFSQEDFNQLRDTFLQYINLTRKGEVSPVAKTESITTDRDVQLNQVVELLEKIAENTRK